MAILLPSACKLLTLATYFLACATATETGESKQSGPPSAWQPDSTGVHQQDPPGSQEQGLLQPPPQIDQANVARAESPSTPGSETSPIRGTTQIRNYCTLPFFIKGNSRWPFALFGSKTGVQIDDDQTYKEGYLRPAWGSRFISLRQGPEHEVNTPRAELILYHFLANEIVTFDVATVFGRLPTGVTTLRVASTNAVIYHWENGTDAKSRGSYSMSSLESTVLTLCEENMPGYQPDDVRLDDDDDGDVSSPTDSSSSLPTTPDCQPKTNSAAIVDGALKQLNIAKDYITGERKVYIKQQLATGGSGAAAAVDKDYVAGELKAHKNQRPAADGPAAAAIIDNVIHEMAMIML